MNNKNNSPETLIRGAGAFIFDLDGTLYDTHGFARRLVLAQPWEGFLMLAERRIRKEFAGGDYLSGGAYYEEFFSRMSRRTGKPEDELRTWYFDRYIPLMCGVLKKYYRSRPGAAELFGYLNQRSFPFAVYSDYPRTAERLSCLGLDPASGAKLYGPEHFGAQKPAVRPFLHIAQDLGHPPDRILVIGDRDDTDGAGAAAAGMAYIGIKNRKTQGVSSRLSWEAFITLFREQLGQPG
ncbi:HAD family hydrolase [Treponema sp. TIM-1]|uniref:HAD family hydrolase n=1 Tax=Treponema sp. TIM-1 TaxID=2898417 RepID=UPI00398187B7